jgi:hypothetical protein
MRNFKHVWKVALVGAALTGLFLVNATSHRITQAAAPPVVQAIATPAAAVELTPIIAVDSKGGGGELSAMNKTD